MASSIHTIIEPRNISFDGFPVRRLLPRIGLKSVGPWLFFDHMGPHKFEVGKNLAVLPHPHINLATVTYLFEGKIMHRDSIGSKQLIEPGAVNLMLAGKGIAHSERSPENSAQTGGTVHGLQLWHGLPEEQEELDPAFYHYPAEDIPELRQTTGSIRVIIGKAYDLESPVITFSNTLYVDIQLIENQNLELPRGYEEMGIYLLSGSISIDGEPLHTGNFASLSSVAKSMHAQEQARVILLGGSYLGKRYMWWNFVSSKRERIEKAMEDWKERNFAKVFEDEKEFVPLPKTDNYSFMKD
jgi:redox-sensitive bicupin YhaK (pirin superfamily)